MNITMATIREKVLRLLVFCTVAQPSVCNRAPDAVIQVQAQCAHGHDVEQRNGPDRESGDHVLVNRKMLELARLESDDTARKVQEVEDDEDNQQQHPPQRIVRAPQVVSMSSSPS